VGEVYEGDFEKTEEWCADFEGYAKGRGLEIKKWYMWYMMDRPGQKNVQIR